MGKFSASWMRAIPGQRHHTFSDETIETGIQSRSLMTSLENEHCPRCTGVALVGHEEVCPHGKDNKALRHSAVLHDIESTLKHDGHVVLHEPRFSTSTSARSDFRLTRATSARGALVPRADVHHDLSIVSLSAKGPLKAAAKLKFPEVGRDRTAVDVLKDFIQDGPLQQRATDKARVYGNHNRNANTNEICVPILMTTGGTLHKEFEKLLDALKPYNRRFLAIRISGHLQQARHGSRLADERWTGRTVAVV